jgi:hypothetical protein
MRPLAIMAFADQSRLISRLCAAKTMESRKPGPRGAVKAREAPAKRLGLDGEHGSGMLSCVHAVAAQRGEGVMRSMTDEHL